MSIKQELIRHIEKIDDQLILEQLTQLLKDSDHSYTAEFSAEQLKEIEKSKQQIKDGNFHTHEEVMKMVKNG